MTVADFKIEEQKNGTVKTTIRAKTDDSSEAEVTELGLIMSAIEEYFVKHGRSASFIEVREG